MKKIKIYLNTFYRPAFIVLHVGLAVFAILLCIIATSIRADILAGESDIIYKYPAIIEKAIFPVYILLPITFLVDINERKKRS